jgi:hypothetical protein
MDPTQPGDPRAEGRGAVARWLPLAVLLLGAALFLPGLGAGLWEPTEVTAANAARHAAGTPPHPPLMYALQAAGVALLGAREIAVRLPVALAALGCLALATWVGMRALGRRAGLYAAVVLATSPAFLFEARQATSGILATTAGLAAWGGVLLLGRAPLAAVLAVSVAGAVVGTLSGGLLVGAVLPLCATALALGLGGPRTRGGKLGMALVAVAAAAACAVTAALLAQRGAPAAWVGGAVRNTNVPPTFDTVLKAVGHGAFPWSALLPLALLHLFRAPGGSPVLPRLQLASVIAMGLAVALIASWRIHEIRYPALCACAMAVGVYLDDALRGEAGGPFAALLAGCGVAILARDLFLSPESLVAAQQLEGLKYPAAVHVQFVHLGFGLCFALVAWVGLGWWRRALLGLLVVAVPYGAFAAHGLMPTLGKHFSSKGLLDEYHRVARAGEPIAQYRISAREAAVHVGEDVRDLRSQPELLEYLKSSGRVFALLPPEDLASLDQAARRGATSYHVLDDSSARALLLSNRLGPGERDRNPLRRSVFREPTHPKHALRANFEGMVELLGFDLPEKASIGGTFKVALHFHVTGKLPPNWKLFVHFDMPAYRVHGDHDPLEGALPTQYWSAGDYILDEHEVDLPRMTTPSGTYTAYMGFWQGDKRLKVVEGPNDGSDRVRLGTLRIE